MPRLRSCPSDHRRDTSASSSPVNVLVRYVVDSWRRSSESRWPSLPWSGRRAPLAGGRSGARGVLAVALAYGRLSARGLSPQEPAYPGIDRFDPAQERKFTTFAAPTILGELKCYFRDKGWSIHVPRDLQERALAVSRHGAGDGGLTRCVTASLEATASRSASSERLLLACSTSSRSASSKPSRLACDQTAAR